MKLLLITIGKLKSGPERDLCERYLTRFQGISRAAGFGDLKLIEISESPQRRADDRMADEARLIAEVLPAGCRLIVLDERGRSPSSEDFARSLRDMREQGAATLALVIGGPDGLHDSLRQKAEMTLGFGRLTMPHQIVRVLLFEQLYRAATLLTGHPYHRS